MSSASVALTLVRALPARPARALATLLVILYLWLRPRYRHEIRTNCELVLGAVPSRFWFQNARRVGENLAAMAKATSSWGKSLIDTAVIQGENSQKLERELHSVMVSFHFGAWEYLPQVFAARGFAVRLAVGRQADTALERQLAAQRASGGVRLLRNLRELLRLPERPTLTGFMLDNTSRGDQHWVVLDRLAVRLPTAPFRLAQRIKTKVIPLFARIERGRLCVEVAEAGDELAVVRSLLARVRRYPLDWVWWGKAGALKRVTG